MKTIYELKRVLQNCINSIDLDMQNPLNRKVYPYLEGKRNAYRTMIYYIDRFNDKHIENDLDEYFLDMIKKKGT